MSATSMKQALQGARSRLRVSEAEAERTAAAYTAAVVIGIGSKGHGGQPPMMSKLAFAGIPGTIVLAVLAKVGAGFMTGTTANIANGVGDAAAIIGVAKFVEGTDIAGLSDSEMSGRRRRSTADAARRLEERLASRLDMSADDELAALEVD